MNETHTLNGIKYMYKLLTVEERDLINKLREKQDGCQYCEIEASSAAEAEQIAIQNVIDLGVEITVEEMEE